MHFLICMKNLIRLVNMKTLMQKMKILGIDKGYDVPVNAVVNYNFGALNEAQLAAMADKLQDAKAAELLRAAAVDDQGEK